MGATIRALIFLAVLTVPGVSRGQVPSGDPLAAAAERARVHDFVGALAELARMPLPDRETARARYLEARMLEAVGRYAEAAARYPVAAEALPRAVRDDAARRRAIAFARLGDCDIARPLLEPRSEGRGRHAITARAWLGHCLVALEQPSRAAQLLRRVATAAPTYLDLLAIRLSLAEALLESGDRAAAIEALRAAWVEHPDHPDAPSIEAQIVALGASVEPTVADRLRRAERLSEVRRHEDAIAELDAAGRPPRGDDLRRWLHLRGMALFKTRRRYAEAAVMLAQAARLRGPTEVEDGFHAARALSRADRDAEAVRAYRRFARAHRGHARAAEAEYLAAWLEIRLGRAAGPRNMRRFASSRGARRNAEMQRKATWQIAFADFEGGRHARAAEGFERYATMGEGALVRGRGLYWLGRARHESGRSAAAITAYREAIAVEPLHWYALLARARLVELGEEPGAPFPPGDPRPAAGPLPEPRVPDAAVFYDGVGLRADALAVVRRRERDIRRAAPRGRGLEALVSVYARLGDVTRPYRLVVTAERAELQRAPDPFNRWIWDAAYPRAFERVVVPAARHESLPPEYLWAIMRQESAYDPEALSYADAIGLMQMLPSTAERIAGGLGVPFAREQLFDPAWNLRYGARYNAGLLRGQDDVVPLALGAFNAGAHRVHRWRRESAVQDLDRFVERIPIDQTRNYVRRVTSHYARYLYLRDPAAGWPLTLPPRVVR